MFVFYHCLINHHTLCGLEPTNLSPHNVPRSGAPDGLARPLSRVSLAEIRVSSRATIPPEQSSPTPPPTTQTVRGHAVDSLTSLLSCQLFAWGSLLAPRSYQTFLAMTSLCFLKTRLGNVPSSSLSRI